MTRSFASPMLADNPHSTAGGAAPSFQLQCPVCRTLVFPCESDPRLVCTVCGFLMSERNGILHALQPEREQDFRQFIEDYETVRAREGRGSSSSDYYYALPSKDLTGRNRWQWKIRARTFRCLERRVLPQIERTHPHGCDVLDVGAGNCWLSYRLALRGHRPVAVDLLDNDADGLGSARHYFDHVAPFPRFQAEMDRLPFASGQFDVAIFNASFHYSIDYATTLNEMLRCLRRPGHILIMDSPFYRREESGKLMLAERRAAFERKFGFASDSIASQEFLTQKILNELGRKLSLQWKIVKPWYGWGWALRPAKARLLGRREPSKFFLIWTAVEV